MYFIVRNMAPKSKGSHNIIVNISKAAKVEALKRILLKKTNIEIEHQILVYKGKQLVDDHKIFDYDIKLNDVVQLLVKLSPNKDSTECEPSAKDSECIKKNRELNSTTNTVGDDSAHRRESPITEKEEEKSSDTLLYFKQESKFYETDDLVDFISKENGSWCEGKIIEILSTVNSPSEDSELIFKVKTERSEFDEFINVTFKALRPRAFYTYKKHELNVGMKVFVSYNIEEPSERGPWFDMQITEIDNNQVIGTVFIGESCVPFMDCNLKFVNEIMKIEEPQLVTDHSRKPKHILFRNIPYNCKKCKDIPTRKCKNCGCAICGGKKDPDKTVMCDECDDGFHLSCLNPPLAEMPSEAEWYCPECKNDENEIVKAGDGLKFSNKKARMASNKNPSRDWGRGMACVGRNTICTIVPINHFGPIPGIEVGTCWKYRIQVSEAGVHRPHVAGIHGKESEGAYSLVLSGGYEDDTDYGEEFYYTGSGGRDLTGNKRISEQSSDQKLTRMNKALAMNCNVTFNNTVGAEVKDWKSGKPVRVVRNYKLGKHSKYAPKDGNRYDGIYKVVKYYPEKGKSNFIVWRYLLRRDDPNPAPWSKGGQELEMIHPPGYLEAKQAEQGDVEYKSRKNNESPKQKEKSSSKRKISNSPKVSKIPKLQKYELPSIILLFINKDNVNEKLWQECQAVLIEGKQNFLRKIEEVFMCAICQELTYKPVTTTCSHNVCKNCMALSFKSENFNCPCCRFHLTSEFQLIVNENLSAVLENLFPGYEAGR